MKLTHSEIKRRAAWARREMRENGKTVGQLVAMFKAKGWKNIRGNDYTAQNIRSLTKITRKSGKARKGVRINPPRYKTGVFKTKALPDGVCDLMMSGIEYTVNNKELSSKAKLGCLEMVFRQL